MAIKNKKLGLKLLFVTGVKAKQEIVEQLRLCNLHLKAMPSFNSPVDSK
jgi:hypothetical protein